MNFSTLRAPVVAAVMLLIAFARPCVAQEASPYVACAGCHGLQGEGNAAVNAPPLAGQSADYLARQLIKFKNGQRGYLENDAPGQVMKAIAQTLQDEAAIRNVAEFISKMPPIEAAPAAASPAALPAQASASKKIFAACAGCHGVQGEGRIIANAPNLALLPSWYLTKSLQDFRSGARGTPPGDHEGRTMRALVRLIPDDQAVQDIATYIDAL